MSRLDDIFNSPWLGDNKPEVLKEQVKILMLELIASIEVKNVPSDDPKIRYWQGYADAQVDITEKVEKL